MEQINLRLKNNKKSLYYGFTLFEGLFSLLVLGMVSMIFSAVIQYTKQVIPILDRVEEKQWHIFLLQLENELQDCHLDELRPNGISFLNQRKRNLIIFEFKNNKIFKIENRGHQPLLMRVSRAEFNIEQQQLMISVTFENHRQLTGKWSIRHEKF